MVKSIGIDPVPVPPLVKLWRFILWSWKDSLCKLLNPKGRTSRGTFYAFIIPIIAVWLGIASWFSTTEINTSSNLYNSLVTLRLACGGLTLLTLPMLIIRRLHDGADESVESLKGVGFFGPATFLYRLLVDFNPSENKYGPPHIVLPKDDEEQS